MVRGGYKRQESILDTANYKLKYSNSSLYKLCGTDQISIFIKYAQTKYLAQLVRQPDTAITKQLLFNSDKYTKRGNPGPTLLSQVIKNQDVKSAEFFSKSMNGCY